MSKLSVSPCSPTTPERRLSSQINTSAKPCVNNQASVCSSYTVPILNACITADFDYFYTFLHFLLIIFIVLDTLMSIKNFLVESAEILSVSLFSEEWFLLLNN